MQSSGSPLDIAFVTPPWYSLPPGGYGGIEAVSAALADGLVDRGHHVTTIGAGPRGTKADHVPTYEVPPSERIGEAVPEVVNAAKAAQALADLDVDIVHDHSLAGALSAGGRSAPTILTTHFPVDGEFGLYYRSLGDTVDMVATSNAQRTRSPGLPWLRTVHNAIDVSTVPYVADKGEHVVFLGSMSPKKGVAEAIEVARRAGRKLVIAAKCVEPFERRYFDEVIRPMLGSDIEWIGELNHEEKWEFLGNAACMLFPSTRHEAFGLVLIEAMATGTPVIALNRGAVNEIIDHGVSGFVCGDVDDMATALTSIEDISPRACRARVRDHFDVPIMVQGYEAAYRAALEAPGKPVEPFSGAA